MAKTQLTGGAFQDAEGNVLANGYLLMQVNQDEQINGTNGQLCAGVQIRIALDSNGNVSQSPAQLVWPNDQLTPAGSWYIVYAYTQAGQLVWGPWYVTVPTNGGTYNVSNWVPGTVQTGALVGSITLQTNEVNNGSQSLLDLHAGSNVTLADNGAGRVTITAAGGGFVAGAGNFSMFGPGMLLNPFMPAAGQAPLLSYNGNNKVNLHRFSMPFSVQISKCVAVRQAGSGSGAFSIYSIDGNTKLIDTGDLFQSTVNNVYTSTFAPVTLSAGTQYWFAWSGTSNIQVQGIITTLTGVSFGNGSQDSYTQTTDGVTGTITNAVANGSQLTLTLSADPASLGFIVGRSCYTGVLSNASFSSYQNKSFLIASLPGGNQVVLTAGTTVVASAACSGTLQQNLVIRGIATNVSAGTPLVMPATLGTVIDSVYKLGQYDVPLPLWAS